MFPAYVADVDERGNLPFVFSNVSGHHFRLRSTDVKCDVEFVPAVVTTATVTREEKKSEVPSPVNGSGAVKVDASDHDTVKTATTPPPH